MTKKTLYFSKKMLFLVSTLSLSFIIPSTFGLIYGPFIIQLVSSVSVLFFGPGLIWSIINLPLKRPALIIEEDHITSLSSIGSFGKIEKKDIVDFKSDGKGFSLELLNPDKYLSQFNLFKKIILIIQKKLNLSSSHFYLNYRILEMNNYRLGSVLWNIKEQNNLNYLKKSNPK